MPRQSSNERQGLLDYERFLSILREELDRAMAPLAKDIKDVSSDLKTMQANTYNREMMDGKLQVITDELKKHDEDLKGIHILIGNSGRELLTRIGAVAGILYTLVLLIPHITKALGL